MSQRKNLLLRGIQIMMTGINTEYSYDDAVAKIREYTTHEDADVRITLTEEQIAQGAVLVVGLRHLLKDINGPIASSYIRRQLPKALGIHADEENIDENAIVAPVVFAARLGKQKASRENTNLITFCDLAHSKAKATNSRYNNFVITLGTPNLPRRHPGADDSYHPEKDIDIESRDLLERGSRTLDILKSDKKAKTCPKVLFLRTAVTHDEDPLSKKLYSGHTIADFAEQIAGEKQLPLNFHFSGHGNLEKVGPMMLENRMTPEDVANYFDHIIESAGLKKALQSKQQPIAFHFDVCNAASTMIAPDATAGELKSAVLHESIIGLFAKKMAELGYRNFTVHGYRGYYATLASEGIEITDSLIHENIKVRTRGEKTLHTISFSGRGFEVTLPKDLKMAAFPVEILRPVPEAELIQPSGSASSSTLVRRF